MLTTKSNSYSFNKNGIRYFSRRVPADLRRRYRTGRIACSLRNALFSLLLICLPNCLLADGILGSIFAIERYRYIQRSYLTEPYDIFCLQRPGFMVELPWDATFVYGDATKGQIEVELTDMGMIECKHGWDLHEMGHVRQGSGGTEWTAVYNDEYLVRFTALSADIIYDENGHPSISAIVHPFYCENNTNKCQIDMRLPLSD